MQTIEIEFGSPWPSYNTVSEAIAGAKAQPEQAKAKRDSVEIAGAVLESGLFGLSSCVLRFLIKARQFHLEWTVSEGEEPKVQPVRRKYLCHTDSEQHWEFDPNAMISAISGSELAMLAVCGPSFLVCTRGNNIFWLSAYRVRSTGSDLLHAVFET